MKKIIIFIFSLMIVFTGCSAKQSAETSKNENSNSVNENTSSPKDNEPKLAYTITTEGAFFENDLYDVALYYPYITGGSKAEDITTEIKKINDERLNNIKEIYEKYTEDNVISQMYLDTYFDYSMCDNFLSVKYTVYEFLGGAHGSTSIFTYNVMNGNDSLLSVSDFFKDDVNHKDVLDKIICDKIIADKDKYFPDAQKTVWQTNYDKKFYINNKGELVIYFSEYELAPYVAGTVEFNIPPSELKPYLKDEYYTLLTQMNSDTLMKFNGEPKEFRNMPRFNVDDFGYEECYLPLREVCELIGYTVTDDKAGNLLINGKNILEFGEPLLVAEIEYVPCEMFNNFDRVLEKDFRSKIVYDNDVIKIFKVNS